MIFYNNSPYLYPDVLAVTQIQTVCIYFIFPPAIIRTSAGQQSETCLPYSYTWQAPEYCQLNVTSSAQWGVLAYAKVLQCAGNRAKVWEFCQVIAANLYLGEPCEMSQGCCINGGYGHSSWVNSLCMLILVTKVCYSFLSDVNRESNWAEHCHCNQRGKYIM